MARYVIQDGGTFYVHTLNPDETEIEPEVTYGYPEEVTDYDMEGAMAARRWFLDCFSPQAEFIFV